MLVLVRRGCPYSAPSTRAAALLLEGLRTRFLMSTVSRRQDAVSYSTPQAEIIAIGYRVSMEAVSFHEENTETMLICESGNAAATHDLECTHRVNLAWLREVCQSDQVRVVYTISSEGDFCALPLCWLFFPAMLARQKLDAGGVTG